MKLLKKITAAVTAMAMAASMMSIGASATTYFDWSVRYYPGAPGNVNKDLDTRSYYANDDLHSYTDTCTTFIQTNNNLGWGAYVDFWGYYKDEQNNITSVLPTHYYNSTGNNTNLTFSPTVPQDTVLTIKHRLNGNGNSCSMGGKIEI